MKIEKSIVFTYFMLFLLIFSVSNQFNINYSHETTQEDLQGKTTYLKSAGFWNNFTFIHITNLNWTSASNKEWCSGSGTWEDPYVIENMIINASASPIGAGIFIENSDNVYFTIVNVTVFDGINGIKLENTSNGTLVNNNLSGNIQSGLHMVNCGNNTISRNQLNNNGGQGIALYSNCNNNKILGNTAKNDGTYQQDYGIKLDLNCYQNNISLNVIEDINNYGIWLVNSDQNYLSNNRVINSNYGFFILLADQSEIIGNTISGSSIGITISGTYGCNIVRNFINNSVNNAIRIFTNSDDNEFNDNIIKDNDGIGVQIDDPQNDNNLFYRNSFISNGLHVYDNGTATFWNTTMVGNYWDSYSGVDMNNDHIGDTPFNIPGAANANDTLPLVDHGPPSITINTPTSSYYSVNSPEFNIFVNETYIYSMWYDINNNGIKYYFTENGTIDQDAWNALSDGVVTITFYTRDIAWNMVFNSVIINKDTGNPIVSIITPTSGKDFSTTAPDYVIEIFDSGGLIDIVWYTINNSGINYYISENGTIEQDAWNALDNGNIIITFYAQDLALNIGYTSVNLVKKAPQGSEYPINPDNGAPPLNIGFIIIISIIIISAIILAGILMKSLPNKGKLEKSRNIDEEHISKAQYMKDVSNILTILAIHNKTGLCLSKLTLHEGIGLDEHLFSGFISAMGCFKNELVKQMGLRVRGEGGDNVIQYNEFTITFMDGEYLRLGLVSYSSLGDLIKQKCGQVLRAYENKHFNELKNFEGEIHVFRDFEETIKAGLELNLNKK